MICNKCGNKIPDGSKFCGYCGSKQTLKKECKNCHQMVDEEFNFCNHCGSSFSDGGNNDVISNNNNQNNNFNNNNSQNSNFNNNNNQNNGFYNNNNQNYNYNSYPTYSKQSMSFINKDMLMLYTKGGLVIAFCLILTFILFAPISSITINETINIEANLIDYVSSFFKGIGTYTLDEFSASVMGSTSFNHTLILILSDFDNEMLFARVAFYLKCLMIFSLVILPIINGILTGLKLIKKERFNGSKNLTCASLIIVLSLLILMPLNGFKVGSGIIVYTIFNVLLFILEYIDRLLIAKPSKQKIVKTSFSLGYSLLLILVFLISLSSIGSTKSISTIDNRIYYSENNSYGVFYRAISLFDEDNIPEYNFVFFDEILGPSLVSTNIKAKEPWLMYFGLSITVTSILICYLLLRTLFIEFSGYNKDKFKKTGSLIITALVISIIKAALTIIFQGSINKYYNQNPGLSKLVFTPSAVNIIFIFLLVGLYIYYSIYKKMNKKIY